jgi:hypothetical protein
MLGKTGGSHWDDSIVERRRVPQRKLPSPSSRDAWALWAHPSDRWLCQSDCSFQSRIGFRRHTANIPSSDTGRASKPVSMYYHQKRCLVPDACATPPSIATYCAFGHRPRHGRRANVAVVLPSRMVGRMTLRHDQVRNLPLSRAVRLAPVSLFCFGNRDTFVELGTES